MSNPALSLFEVLDYLVIVFTFRFYDPCILMFGVTNKNFQALNISVSVFVFVKPDST